MTKRIILLNAPAGAGKDAAARFLGNTFRQRGIVSRHLKFAEILKNEVHVRHGIKDVPANHFESLKDTPLPEFNGKTPRQAYIDYSEKEVKPKFGHDYWAQRGAQTAEASDGEVMIFSDCGFQPEVDVIVAAFGAENVQLVQIQRPGKTYIGDSRNWTYSHNQEVVIENDSTESALEDECTIVALQLIKIWKLRK